MNRTLAAVTVLLLASTAQAGPGEPVLVFTGPNLDALRSRLGNPAELAGKESVIVSGGRVSATTPGMPKAVLLDYDGAKIHSVLYGRQVKVAASVPRFAQRLKDNRPGAHWRAMPSGVGNGNVGAKIGRVVGIAGGAAASYYIGPIVGAVAGRVGANIGERVGKRVGANVHGRMTARRG